MEFRFGLFYFYTFINELDQWFSKCGPRPAALVSYGHLLEMNITGAIPGLLIQKL